MHDCWDDQPSQRPSFEAIAQRLRVLRRGAGSRQGSTTLTTRPSGTSVEGHRSNDVSFSAPSDDVMQPLPSLNDMVQATSSGGESSGREAMPVKFSLQPADPHRLFSGGSSNDGDVANALSMVTSTAAAAAAVELTLSHDDQGSVERGWQPQLGELPEGEDAAEVPRSKKTWSRFLNGRAE